MLESLGINPQYILVSFVGFLILLFVLTKYAFGPLVAVLQARQDKIRGDLDEAQRSKDEMVRLQQEYTQRLNQIEDEARDKIAAAVREAQAARDEILNRAHSEASAIVQRGQEEVAAERAKAIVEARNQIVDLASLMASRTVRQTLNASSQAQLVDEAIAGINQN